MIQYTQRTLGNGLRVIVHEDPQVAKAAVNLVYRVGARDEQPERTGFAHLFEHLMFEGSVNIPHYDQHLQRAGADNNAFTNSDITCYYITLPADQLETAFWLESDRMLGLDFSQEKLAIQQSVVIEEFKQRYLNQPYGDAYLLLRPVAYQVHPYQWLTIGKEIQHVADATMEDVQAFFYGFYAPNNCTLVVAGGVKADEVFRLAEKWFGPIPSRPLQKHPLPVEPRQTEARAITVRRPVPAAQIFKTYHMPGRTEQAYYAADMLGDLLSHGKASRMHRNLVQDTGLCTRVGAFSWGLYDPGTLSINCELAPGTEPARVDEALEHIFQNLDTLEQPELDRAVTKIESSEAFERTEIASRALGLALFDSMGQLEEMERVVGRYRALTPADLLAARDEVLRPTNATTLYYLPEEGQA